MSLNKPFEGFIFINTITMHIFTEGLIFIRSVTAIPLATKLFMRLVNTSKYVKSNKDSMLLKLILFC